MRHEDLDLVIRRPVFADGPAIEAMFARCSLESRYARFLAPLRTIPAADLERIVTPTAGGEAWIGVTRDDPEMVVSARQLGCGTATTPRLHSSWKTRGSVKASAVPSSGCSRREHGTTACAGCRASVLRESRHVLRMPRAVLGATSMHSDGYATLVTIERP